MALSFIKFDELYEALHSPAQYEIETCAKTPVEKPEQNNKEVMNND